MNFIKNTLLAFAVSMTAMFNITSAQSEQVIFNTTSCGQNTIEITYTSDVPKYISFMLYGDTRFCVGSYARVSNVSNNDGTCTATYDIAALLSSASGELFAKAYYTTKFMKVYDGKIIHGSNPTAQVLFVVEGEDFICNN